MNFEEKLSEQFDKFSLSARKHTKNLEHLYADYLELLCVLSNDSFTTPQIFLNRFKKEDEEVVEKEDASDTQEIGSTKAENDDTELAWAIEIFNLTKFRGAIFREDYPFEIYDNLIRIKDELSLRNKIYLALLLSSNLNYFSKLESFLTTDFEQISHQALKDLFFSEKFTVKNFGKNPDYEGTAQEKIRALGKDLNVDLNDNEIDTILGNQERGLDLACWRSFEDKVPNLISIFVQCACGKDWFKKQHETRRFQNAYFRFFRLNPINSMFIPYSLLKDEQGYFQSDEIDDILFFDRKRILEVIEESEFFEKLITLNIVDACIDYEEDLV